MGRFGWFLLFCLLQSGSDLYLVFLWTHGIIFLVLHPFYSAGEEMRRVSVLPFNSFASFLLSPGAPKFLLCTCKWLEFIESTALTLLEKENHLCCLLYQSREPVCILCAFMIKKNESAPEMKDTFFCNRCS